MSSSRRACSQALCDFDIPRTAQIPLRRFVDAFQKFIRRLLNTLLCGALRSTATALDVTNELDVDYTMARKRGIIKGISSYNILENPVYQESFGVDRRFARMHKHVGSVLKFQAEAQIDRLSEMSEGDRPSAGGASPRPPPGKAPSDVANAKSRGQLV